MIPFEVNSAAYNMAVDEHLLNGNETVLRTYGWNLPSLSIGRNCKKLDDVDIHFCKSANIELVRRLTGGKNVLHQHEVTYSFVSDSESFSNSIIGTYKLIAEALLDCFREFKIPAEMGERVRPKSSSTICFNEISSYEVSIKNKKLVGSAQCRKANRFLQHGSILLRVDWDLWRHIWRIPNKSNVLQRRITSIWDEIGKQIDPIKLSKVLAKSFQQRFSYNIEERKLNANENLIVRQLLGNYKWKED